MQPLSYQLYSSRNFPPLPNTLKMLAEIGYAQVEGYGGLYADASALDVLAEGLRNTGLAMPTGHFSLDMVRDQSARVLTIAQVLGVKSIYVPHITPDQRPADSAGWLAFGKDLAEMAKPYWDAGLAVGWHNHDFEVKATPQGDLPLNQIMAADPRLVLELDVAWVVRGGVDPMTLIARHGARITAAHVKDIAPVGQNTDEDGWADVGTGTMDWKSLTAALKAAGCTTFVMEHDNPSDHKRFATRSFAAASAY